MDKTRLYFLLLSVFFLCYSTGIFAQESFQAKVALTEKHSVLLLDSIVSSSAITTDEKDHFFERVTLTEVSIQMKKKLECVDRMKCIADYKEFLSTDVSSFSADEIEKISNVFESIKTQLHSVNSGLIDRDILLIKTKGNHYGDGVYYTRENKIVIPQNVLDNFNESSFLQTMLHEFFHIFSRYNEKTRNELYALIGFFPIEKEMDFGQWAPRVLLNPDGTTHYAIKLDKFGMAYPMISATEDHFVLSKPRFFDYLDFHLYTIEEEAVAAMVKKQINLQDAPSFFQQIKDNTNYIIHPDEIMADNFIYTVFYLSEGKKIKNFSDEGMQLIDQFGSILKNHHP